MSVLRRCGEAVPRLSATPQFGTCCCDTPGGIATTAEYRAHPSHWALVVATRRVGSQRLPNTALTRATGHLLLRHAGWDRNDCRIGVWLGFARGDSALVVATRRVGSQRLPNTALTRATGHLLLRHAGWDRNDCRIGVWLGFARGDSALVAATLRVGSQRLPNACAAWIAGREEQPGQETRTTADPELLADRPASLIAATVNQYEPAVRPVTVHDSALVLQTTRGPLPTRTS